MKRFVAHLLSEISPPLAGWASPAMLERTLTRRIYDGLRACTDEERAESFARACPVDGATAGDYLARVLELPGGRALVGIRFKGGDTGLPFVELIAVDHELGSTWDELGVRAKEAFGVFRPRWLRAAVPAGRPRPARARADLHVVAGPLARDLRAPPPDVSFERCHDLDFLAEYEAEYARFHAGASELAREVPSTAREGFVACLTDGAIVCVRANGVWAGVAAAARGTVWAVDGFEVQEELLAGHLRGRGLGPSLQRTLMSVLASKGKDGGELLVGTIHDKNAPSLATARRCGREVVATFWFVDL